MWEEIIRVAAGNGLWALLFCVLFIHQLKDSKKREEKYTETIKVLGERLDVVNEIKQDTEKIKKHVVKKGAIAAESRADETLLGKAGKALKTAVSEA